MTYRLKPTPHGVSPRMLFCLLSLLLLLQMSAVAGSMPTVAATPTPTPSTPANTKYQAYSSNANSAKLTVSLLKLMEAGDGDNAKLADALVNTPFATYENALNGNVSLVVDVITTPTRFSDATLKEFSVDGASVRDYYPAAYRLVMLVTDLDALNDLAALNDVIMIKPQYKPKTYVGSVDSEADYALGADMVRSDMFVDGFGQKVGILSDSFARGDVMYQEGMSPAPGQTGVLMGSFAQSEGDLPAGVQILRDDYVGNDEGAAMGEVIYDIAPGASLAFHTAFGGEATFADGIRKLRNAGATVLVDNVRYPDEPMYQNGLAGLAASEAQNSGIPFFSAAGNDGSNGSVQTFHDINPTVQEGVVPPRGGDLHDWGGSNAFLPITVPASGTVRVMMQWNQPFSSLSPFDGAQIDLDLYVLDTNDPSVLGDADLFNEHLIGKGEDGQGDSNRPMGDAFEIQDYSYTNESSDPATVYLLVNRFQGRRDHIPQNDSVPVEFRIVLWEATEGVTMPLSGPTLFGHPATANLIGVGAVPWWDAPTCDSATPDHVAYPELFSSRGGTTRLFFDRDGDYDSRSGFQPVIAGVDDLSSLLINSGYVGTSAAAAGAAGVGALLRQSNVKKSPAQISSTLASTACDVTGYPAAPGVDDITGNGVINAYNAAAQLRTGTNLALYRPEDWGDRLVLSQDTDATYDDGTYATGRPVYANFAVANNGTTRVKGAQITVYLDGKSFKRIRTGKLEPNDAEALFQNINLGVLSAGIHSVRVYVDSNNRVRETNETDNVYDKSILVSVPAANDNFASRTQLSGVPQGVTGSNLAASKEAGEPNHADNPGGRSIWYAWKAPFSGPVTITTAGSSFDTLLAVYTGSAVNALQLIAQNDNVTDGNTSKVTFYAVAGTEYEIAIDGAFGDFGTSVLNFSGGGNDFFSQRTLLPSGCSGSVTDSNVFATRESGEVDHANAHGSHSVWFRWIAPTTGQVTFDTLGSDFDTALAVYNDNRTTTVVSNDNVSTLVKTSSVTFSVTLGTAYSIAVDGAGTAAGNIVLNWTATPTGDAFAKATKVTGATSSKTGLNLCATRESDEPNHAGQQGYGSVWYKWTATTTGTVNIAVLSEQIKPLVGVYTGSTLGSLTPVSPIDTAYGTSEFNQVLFQAQGGVEYKIAVDSQTTDTGNFNLYWTTAVPANDAFSKPQVISGCSGSLQTNNLAASRETSEPVIASTPGGASIWFSWQAPSSDPVTFDTAGSSIDTLLGVYTGNAVSATTLVAQNNDAAGSPQAALTFTPTAGTTYKIVVDGKNGQMGTVLLGWQSQLTNDAFASRQTLTGNSGTVQGTNACASAEANEPPHAGQAAQHSLWFTWTPTVSGPVVFNTLGSNFDTVLAVYTGNSLGSLVEVASNDNSGSAQTSSLTFNATPGVQYQIALDGKDGSTGSFVLNWALGVSNDSFANPTPLDTSSSGSLTASNVTATSEVGEPAVVIGQSGKTLWYSWFSPDDKQITVDTFGSNFNTVLAVWSGTDMSALSLVAKNDDYTTGVQQSRVSFLALANTHYLIEVDGVGGAAGDVRLNWYLAFPPPNDMFSQATSITGCLGAVTGYNTAATKEAGEPNHAGRTGGASVWYQWTGQVTGTLTVDVTDANFDTILAVYSGNSVGNLTPLAFSAVGTTSNSVTFTPTAGNNIFIAVDGKNAQMGAFLLRWNCNP